MKGQHLQAERQGGRLVIGKRPEVKRREELTTKPNRSQTENIELILLQQRAIMEHLGIE